MYNLNELYLNHPLFLNFSIIIFCLLIGSFLNMLIYRLPIMIFNDWEADCHDFLKIKHKTKKNNITLFNPSRSICPSCQQQILFTDNIPLISFVLLKAKCRHCKAKISWRYFFIELLTAVVGFLVVLNFGISILGAVILLLSFILILIAAIDYDHMIIPDYLSYVGLWTGLIISTTNYQIISTDNALYGAVFGYLFIWSIYWAFKLITNKEGFGHGDFKLCALFGAWLGPYNILPMLIIASISGIITSIIRHVLKLGSIDKPFPFGPHLVLAGWIMLMYGAALNFDFIRLFE